MMRRFHCQEEKMHGPSMLEIFLIKNICQV